MKTRTYLISTVLSMALVGGCASTTHKTARQESQENWTNARASVAEGLARDQFKAGNLRQARTTIDQVVAMADARASSHLLSAQIAIEEGKLESAKQSLARAAQLDQKDPEIDYFLGIVNQRWQRGEEALANYTAAATKKPDDLAYTIAQAEMMVQLDRVNDAIALLEKRVVFFESSSAIRDTLAQLLERRNGSGDQPRAIDLYRQAVVLSADDSGVRERWAIALYRGGQFDQAKAVIGRLLQDPQYAKRTDLLLAMANAQMNTAMPSEARSTFDQIVSIESKHVQAHIGVAKSSMMLEDFARARVALARAQTLANESIEVAMLQSTLAIKQSRWSDADKQLSGVLLVEPENATALALSALTKSKMGQANEARAAIAKAVQSSPGDEWVASIQHQVERTN
jgi:Tfp pilus assembly protein PilF